MLKFTKDHEWLRIEGDVATVGITPYAQEQLGDLVFVEVPLAGRAVERGAAAAVVELVKAASDVYAPISGEVIEGNAEIVKEPSLVNSDPMGKRLVVQAADQGRCRDRDADERGRVSGADRVTIHRHARTCSGHPRLRPATKTWMAGPSPAMTIQQARCRRWREM